MVSMGGNGQRQGKKFKFRFEIIFILDYFKMKVIK